LADLVGTLKQSDHGRWIVPLPHPSGASLWLNQPHHKEQVAQAQQTVIDAVAVEMDFEAINCSPAHPASAATGAGYSRMAFTVGLLAQYIRGLGYQAIPCGNDTACSIPIAIDAGLDPSYVADILTSTDLSLSLCYFEPTGADQHSHRRGSATRGISSTYRYA